MRRQAPRILLLNLCVICALAWACLSAWPPVYADEAPTPEPVLPGPIRTMEVPVEVSSTPTPLLLPPTSTPLPDTPTPLPPSTDTPAPLPTHAPTIEAAPPTDTPHTTVEAPTNTSIPTSTETATHTPTHTATHTPTHTSTPTHTATGTPTPTWQPPGPECQAVPGETLLRLDVPYIHQVNDIDTADGNWACGPTSLAMVLAYYGKLPTWKEYEAMRSESTAVVATDSPTPVVSPTSTRKSARTPTPTPLPPGAEYAPYVTEPYTLDGHSYTATAKDPKGNAVAGLYGEVCPAGLADWGRMARVLDWHGLSSREIGVSWDAIVAALKRGHPVILGNDLTPLGHILVVVGYTDNGNMIVNDPYGDRMSTGYGGTSGKGVVYPWKCMRATNAVEVIGIYPPPTRTATQTLTPTVTPTPTITATSTSESAPISLIAPVAPAATQAHNSAPLAPVARSFTTPTTASQPNTSKNTQAQHKAALAPASAPDRRGAAGLGTAASVLSMLAVLLVLARAQKRSKIRRYEALLKGRG